MRVWLSTLVVIAGTVSALPAQSPHDRFTVLSCGLLYLDDVGFRKELTLTADQVTKLAAERDKLTTAYGKRTLFALLQEAGPLAAKIDKELLAILNEKQATRWRQLVLHDFKRRFGAFRTVRLPEVQSTLKLRSEQVSRLENGDDVAVVLDVVQRRQWQEMAGNGLPLTLTLPPPLVVSWPTPLESNHLHALAMPTIQRELKLDENQGKQLEALRQEWLREHNQIRLATPQRQPDMGKDLVTKIDKGISKVLTRDQHARLHQLTHQLRLPRGIPLPMAIFLDEPALASLKLSREQATQVAKILDDRRSSLGKAAETSAGVAEFMKAVDAANEQAGKQLDAVLDATQKQRVAEFYGKPFTGRRVPVEVETLQPDPVQTSPMPLLLRVVPYLQKEPLASELKIDEKQKQALATLEQTLADEVVRATETTIRKDREQKRDVAYTRAQRTFLLILTAEQQTRLCELLIQYLETVPEGRPEFRIQALPRWPEMVKELNLSEDQLTHLDDALHITQVLTADQWKKWKQLRGKPCPLLQTLIVEQDAIPLPARLNYLEEAPILHELKLSDDQRKKLREGIERWRELALRSTVWTPNERKEKMAPLRKQIHDELFGMLTEAQSQRLSQIGRQQWLKEEGLMGLFEIAETESALNLDADQKANLKELKQERELVDRLLRQQHLNFGSTTSELNFWHTVHQEDLARLEKLLTPEQRKRLGELMGKPFEAPLTPYALKSTTTAGDEFRLFGFAPPR